MRSVKLGLLIVSILLSGAATAGEVKVEYKDYKKFSDMRPSNEARGRLQLACHCD
jgi:uncharacterized protein YceH (UPF0502 family)